MSFIIFLTKFKWIIYITDLILFLCLWFSRRIVKYLRKTNIEYFTNLTTFSFIRFFTIFVVLFNGFIVYTSYEFIDAAQKIKLVNQKLLKDNTLLQKNKKETLDRLLTVIETLNITNENLEIFRQKLIINPPLKSSTKLYYKQQVNFVNKMVRHENKECKRVWKKSKSIFKDTSSFKQASDHISFYINNGCQESFLLNFRYGYLLRERKDYNSALKYLLKADNILNNRQRHCSGLDHEIAICYLLTEQYEIATKYLKKGLEINSANPLIEALLSNMHKIKQISNNKNKIKTIQDEKDYNKTEERNEEPIGF